MRPLPLLSIARISIVSATICLALPAYATDPETTYMLTPRWNTANACWGGTNVFMMHNGWHMCFGGGKQDFLDFHREFLAQFDDYRLYTIDGGSGNPYPAIVAHEADDAVPLAPAHTNLNGYSRPANHLTADPHPHAGGGTFAQWTIRPSNLLLGNATFHSYTTQDAIGDAIDGPPTNFHGNGHVTIGRHDRVGTNWGDMMSTLNAVRDGGFYQWHKNVDNIYADWAAGQYRKVDNSGLPHFLSVSPNAVGAPGSTLEERTESDVYETDGATSLYGAHPRVASDIYVADDDGNNLVFQPGVRRWSSPPNQDVTKFWDVDAYSTLNRAPGAWYFSVTPTSVGKGGTTVNGQAQRGGDIYTSPGDMTNALHRLEVAIGLTAAATDNVDALEVDDQRRIQGTNDDDLPGIMVRSKRFFSLAPGSINGLLADSGGGTYVAVVPSDVLYFAQDGVLTIAVGHAEAGLVAADDLDALAIEDVNTNDLFDAGDKIHFSLAAGSPSLGADSPADILVSVKGVVGHSVEVLADNLGLLATDDVDGLGLLLPDTGTGACCLPSGLCEERTQASCEGDGGTYMGDGTDCNAIYCPSALGACCEPDGSCTQKTDVECAAGYGTFQGVGVTCNQTFCFQPPPNDLIYNAYVLDYSPPNYYDEVLTDNTFATTSVSDPPYSCHDHGIFFPPYASGTLWFAFQATLPHAVLQCIPSSDGGYTRLAVYAADSTLNLTEIGCSESLNGVYTNGSWAEVDTLEVGQTYYAQVGTIGDANKGQLSVVLSETGVTAVDQINVRPKSTLLLEASRPNPFSPATSVVFETPRAGHVSLRIYDATGRLVRTLLDSEKAAGRHSVMWDGRNEQGSSVSSGVYFVRLEADGAVETGRMVRIK